MPKKRDLRVRTRTAYERYVNSAKSKAKIKTVSNADKLMTEPGNSAFKQRRLYLRPLVDLLLSEGVEFIGDLTGQQVETAYLATIKKVKPRIGPVAAANTVNVIHTCYSGFIRFFQDSGAIRSDIAKEALDALGEAPEKEERPMLIIAASDWPEIFKIAHKRHIVDRVALELGFYLSMRAVEARAARWSNFDFEKGTVRFYRQKPNKHLVLYIHPELMATLKEYRQWLTDTGTPPEDEWPVLLAREDRTLKTGHRVNPNWPCKPGVGIDPEALRQGVKHAIHAFGISEQKAKGQAMHTTRRGRAVQLKKSGEDIEMIADILGHKHSTTTKTYIRNAFDNEEIREAMTKPIVPTTELELAEPQPPQGVTLGSLIPVEPGSPQEAAMQVAAYMQRSGLFEPEDIQKAVMRGLGHNLTTTTNIMMQAAVEGGTSI